MSGSIFLERGEISVNETAGTVSVTIVRTGDLSLPTTIEYGTNAGTATSGTDFTEKDGFVTMAAGQDRVVVTIPIKNDTNSEATETFNFSLVNVSSGDLLFPRTQLINILDDENPVTPPAVPDLVSDYNVTLDAVVKGLTAPIAIEFSPLDSKIAYVASQAGTITAYNVETGQKLATVLDIQGKTNFAADRGLMDFAIHPNFPAEPYVYVFYVVDPPDAADETGLAGLNGRGNRFAYVSRFEVDAKADYLKIVPGSEKVLLGGAGQTLDDISGKGALNFNETVHADKRSSEVDPVTGKFKQDYIKVDSTTHAGGSLVFGPDGNLYVTTGDGTAFDYADPRSADVQNLNSLSGKVLRIDPMTGKGVADNPFATGDLNSNQSKVYQLGLRNPFAATFDLNGKLVISETGWHANEEINSGGPGANFGWPYYEGGDGGVLDRTPIYKDTAAALAFYQKVQDGTIKITAPVRSFSHGNTDPGFQVQAIVGANSVYSGDKYGSEFNGAYFFSDVVEGEIYILDLVTKEVKYLVTVPTGFAPVHYKQGPDGYLYYADIVTGQIGKLLITPTATLYYDKLAEKEFLTGATARDVFVIDDQAANYTIEVTGDGTGVVVYTTDATDDTFDNLFKFESVRFKDKTIDLEAVTGLTINGTGAADSITPTLSPKGTQKTTILADTINAGAGNDLVEGGAGNDTILGGTGNDRLIGNQGKDILYGSYGNDVLTASPGNDVLYGGVGDDLLFGESGNDKLYLGSGYNVLKGGVGFDQFILNSAVTSAEPVDLIRDFTPDVDVFVINGTRISGLEGIEGTLDKTAFKIGTQATTAAHRVIYVENSGYLLYDKDGVGGAAAVRIAKLGEDLNLHNTDFLIL